MTASERIKTSTQLTRTINLNTQEIYEHSGVLMLTMSIL